MPYSLNGQNATISEEPTVRNGKHYVPLAEVVQQLGGNVNWDNNAKTATATIGQWTATIRMGDQSVDVSGTPVTMSAPAYVENDTMYVPWDFFRDAYGYKANMEGDTLYVHL
jgi:hypothetical protein